MNLFSRGEAPKRDLRVSQWTNHKLPERIDGKSFVDVGCWEGLMCMEAVKHGASTVLGIDYCTSAALTENLQGGGFSFLQMDMFSEKLLELPEFDIVHCAGVLYHVENPLSLLFRLRKICKPGGLIYVETTCLLKPDDAPLMLFHPGDSLDNNPSNWWTPNEACLREMFLAVGLADIETTFRRETPNSSRRDYPTGRIVLKGTASNRPDQISEKILPRRPSFMPLSEGQGNRR